MAVDRRTFMKRICGGLAAGSVFLYRGPARADSQRLDTPPPGPGDTCPVCGMFVAKYPEWIATIVFGDGTAVHFDGAKDMFKYLLDMAKYAGSRREADIRAVAVTEYYGVERIDGRQALYVIGSDVLGPMGHDLIPFMNRADAEEFMTDHRGKRIVTFDDVNLSLCRYLDRGDVEAPR